MSTLLSRDRILVLLEALATALHVRGYRGDLFLVGGAAMALAYDTRRATRDLDAVFEPKLVVYEAAARVAEANGLPSDWLNDAVKGLLPGPDPDAQVLFDKPGLALRLAVAAPVPRSGRSHRSEDDKLTFCASLRQGPRCFHDPSETRRPHVQLDRGSDARLTVGENVTNIVQYGSLDGTEMWPLPS